MTAFVSTVKMSIMPTRPFSLNYSNKIVLKPRFCSAVHQVQQQDTTGILCDSCNGTGWLHCDFCNGQKINVKSPTNRIYRRCPSCKATGYILCSKCKVYKCVIFPDANDGA